MMCVQNCSVLTRSLRICSCMVGSPTFYSICLPYGCSEASSKTFGDQNGSSFFIYCAVLVLPFFTLERYILNWPMILHNFNRPAASSIHQSITPVYTTR